MWNGKFGGLSSVNWHKHKEPTTLVEQYSYKIKSLCKYGLFELSSTPSCKNWSITALNIITSHGYELECDQQSKFKYFIEHCQL